MAAYSCQVHAGYMGLWFSTKRKESKGFSLVELTVAFAIASLLAVVAVIFMRGPVQKATISECQQQIGALLRAAQSYHFNNGEHADRISLIEREIYVPACKKADPEYCRENPIVKASSAMSDNQSNFNAHWTSPNGHCKMQHRGGYGSMTQFWARPSDNSPFKDWTISGCWNSQTGAFRIENHSYTMTAYNMRNNDSC